MAHALLPPRPHGLGTSAAALAETGRPARAVAALYCPTAVRDDTALAQQVQEPLEQWAAGFAVPPAAVAGLGRLAVLSHPDTDDPARLGAAAKLLAAGHLIETATLPHAATVAQDSDAPDSDAHALARAVDTALQEVYDACDLPSTPPTADVPTLHGRPAAAAAATAAAAAAAAGTTAGTTAAGARPVTDIPLVASALAAFSALPASPTRWTGSLARLWRCRRRPAAPQGRIRRGNTCRPRT
ncbi:hypothetical protein ACFQ9X_25535 [Catenulispora yoronensis]